MFGWVGHMSNIRVVGGDRLWSHVTKKKHTTVLYTHLAFTRILYSKAEPAFAP